VSPPPVGRLDCAEAWESRRSIGVFETIEAGGTTSGVYASGDAGPGTPGVVVFHAWWGLNDDVVAYVDRLAAAGFAVVAPDLFSGQVASTIEDADRLSGAADEAAVDAIALAAVDHLADRLGPAARLAALGFSFGAAWSMWSPAERDRLVASVVYYGSIEGPSLSRASVPVLGHFAETDPYESDEAIAAFEATLRSAGRDVVIHRYPGTGHWFAEPSRDAYRAAAAELAFERTVAFLGRHLETSTG
jgi:carboxymethylenebutenolidase